MSFKMSNYLNVSVQEISQNENHGEFRTLFYPH